MSASVQATPGGTRPAVLVTGASRGIGEACVRRLVRDGWRVFAGVRTDAAAARLQSELGDAVLPVILDVTDPALIRAAASTIEADTGHDGLTALVNNAGIAVAGPLEFLPIDEFRRQLEVNVTGQIAVTQACLPLLRRARMSAPRGQRDRAGRIIFMSSVSGRSALPLLGPYAASKFALEAAADALRVELRPFGIRVVLVEPGVILTPIWDTSLASARRAGERMPAEAYTWYGRSLDGLAGMVESGMRGLPPESVAGVVARALAAPRPRARYVVGRDARARILMQTLLPVGVRDRIVAFAMKRLQRQGRHDP
ncbi:MAG TPA: SDR family oxidoreductase [Longimicrobiales bacterium]|nr:SDR family oxidoreductase [Longimicrobiales bacterium]